MNKFVPLSAYFVQSIPERDTGGLDMFVNRCLSLLAEMVNILMTSLVSDLIKTLHV